jgi:FKBP-type peptidyl-prolyl cis-trans isomerase FkpA
MIRRSLFLVLMCGAAVAMAQNGGAASASASAQVTLAPVVEADPLIKEDIVLGTGREAQPGNTVVVHYTGWLYRPMLLTQRGKQFDSSRDPGRTPFDFRLGGGMVIKGWDQGVAGMKVGGKRTLIIPAHLAYGARAMGEDIKPNSNLIFDVELLDVK